MLVVICKNMSRVLAQLMGAAEPQFRAQVMRLEQAAGLPGADIRLMMDIVGETRGKLRDLGLDPHNTTGPELYEALRTKLLRDEIQVRAALNMRADGTPLAVTQAVKNYLDTIKLPTQVFVVKQPVMRAVLKKLQPKTTMKRLGYRSLDSMIKHESPAQLLAATAIVESRDWHARRIEAYRKLKSSDFEVRKAAFLLPVSKRWPEIAGTYTAKARHDLLAVPELGAVVLLPLEHDLPGLAITTLLLAVDALNDMRSLASYLKFQQVKPDFGGLFVRSLTQEPLTAAEIGDQLLPWKTVQWFYGRNRSPYHPDVFQPHLQPEDLSWHDAEALLAQLHPVLEFWQDSQLLALVDGNGEAVSLNMLDVALSVCNGLEYAQRLVHTMRLNLGRELMARYLRHDNLQALLLGKLDEQLVPEIAE